MAIERTGDKRMHVELTVLESQREELQLAWHEIVAGRRTVTGKYPASGLCDSGVQG